ALPAELLLDVDVRARAGFVAALEALLVADDVELSAVDATALLAVDGPDAAGLLGVADLAPFVHVETSVSGVPVRALRASEVRGDGVILSVPAGQAAGLGEALVAAGGRPGGVGGVGGRPIGVRALRASEVRGDGVILSVPAGQAAALWDALVAAGARPCGMEALEGRRVEVGVPRIGLDMGAKTLALEVPVDDAISITKGCYLGQEVVARGTARGHVNRRLVALRLAGDAPARG